MRRVLYGNRLFRARKCSRRIQRDSARQSSSVVLQMAVERWRGGLTARRGAYVLDIRIRWYQRRAPNGLPRAIVDDG